MDNYDFFANIVDAIATDDSIETWAQANFGQSLKVYADLQSEALPLRDDMPYAIIHTPGVEKHQERREQRYMVSVDLAINKDALVDDSDANVEQPAGIELIMDLSTLVAAAVAGSLPDNTAMGYSLSADTLGALPEVHAYLDFDFTTTLTIGSNPLG